MVTEIHTASLGSRHVDIILMRELMESIESMTMNVRDQALLWQIEPTHHYWNSSDGTTLGPDSLLKIEKWETAEIDFPHWKEHIMKVKNANLDYPIWICDIPDNSENMKRVEVIFDGMHRYTKAIKENRKTLLVKKIKYENIPEKYFIG